MTVEVDDEVATVKLFGAPIREPAPPRTAVPGVELSIEQPEPHWNIAEMVGDHTSVSVTSTPWAEIRKQLQQAGVEVSKLFDPAGGATGAAAGLPLATIAVQFAVSAKGEVGFVICGGEVTAGTTITLTFKNPNVGDAT
jgi:hypothetical protein